MCIRDRSTCYNERVKLPPAQFAAAGGRGTRSREDRMLDESSYSHAPPAVFKVLRRAVGDVGTRCWLYTGGRNQDGYGIAYTDGRTKVAHRVVYEGLIAPVPPGCD